jgi:hypothetical protein
MKRELHHLQLLAGIQNEIGNTIKDKVLFDDIKVYKKDCEYKIFLQYHNFLLKTIKDVLNLKGLFSNNTRDKLNVKDIELDLFSTCYRIEVFLDDIKKGKNKFYEHILEKTSTRTPNVNKITLKTNKEKETNTLSLKDIVDANLDIFGNNNIIPDFNSYMFNPYNKNIYETFLSDLKNGLINKMEYVENVVGDNKNNKILSYSDKKIKEIDKMFKNVNDGNFTSSVKDLKDCIVSVYNKYITFEKKYNEEKS